MNGQRACALLMLWLQAALFGHMTQAPLFPIVVALAASAGFVLKLRIDLAPRQRFWAGSILAVAMLVKYRFAPHSIEIHRMFFLFPMAHVVGQYFLVMQAGCFFIKSKGDRPPVWTLAAGVLVIVCAGDVYVTERDRLLYELSGIGYLVLACVQQSLGRAHLPESKPAGKGRALLAGVVLASVGIGTWISVALIDAYHRELETWFVSALRPTFERQGVGFSGRGQLGSVARMKADDSDAIAMRIEGTQAPGYLRGRAFDEFSMEQSSWYERLEPAPIEGAGVDANGTSQQRRSAGDRVPLEPLQTPSTRLPELDVGRRLYQIREPHSAEWERHVCRPVGETRGTLFTTLETEFLATPLEEVSRGRHGICLSRNDAKSLPYTLFSAGSPRVDARPFADIPPDSPVNELLLSVPENIDPRIEKLADRLFEGSADEREKIAAVVQYFHENYAYEIGIQVPAGEDPLTYFLLEKPAAHCEYFASGAAILLRLGGVPTRYVTGYVAAEKNAVGDYWIARHHDAHAWVEAFCPGEGWITVEATPPSGVPNAKSEKTMFQLWEYLKSLWSRMQDELAVGGVWAFVKLIGAAMISKTGLVLAAIVVAFVAIRRRRPRLKTGHVSPELAAFHRLLGRVDRALERRDLPRGRGETLSRYAQRIRAAAVEETDTERFAEWYETYARLRYSGAIDSSTVERLEGILPV